MSTVRSIYNLLCQWAPLNTAAAWDNVGLQIGHLDNTADTVCVAVDIDSSLLQQLKNERNTLVITHHPLFFAAIKQIDLSTELGDIINTFLTQNHTLISMHTNLDVALGGVNHCLINAYEFDPSYAHKLSDDFGHFIQLDSPKDFNDILSLYPAHHVGSQRMDPIRKLGFGCGSGKSLISSLKKHHIDTFITGELGYHDQLYCELNGIRVILLGHKESEQFVLSEIQTRIRQILPDIPIGIYQ